MIAILRTPEATYLMQILASAFLAILFLQSGIDKILDRRGNFEWLKGHFAKSPLAGIVPALLDLHHDPGGGGRRAERRRLRAGNSFERFDDRVLRGNSFRGSHHGAVFGQRIAKDYAGAAVLVPYFLLTLVAIYLLAEG